MEVKATAKTVRIAPRKVRLVLDLVRGKDAKEAEAILKFTPNHAAEAVGKVLKSAVANAVNNHQLDESKLYVKALCQRGNHHEAFHASGKGQRRSDFKAHQPHYCCG